MNQKKISVGLLSHYFEDPNLGCVALSICNIILLDKAAMECGDKIKYIIYVNEKQPHLKLSFTENEYEYRTYTSCKQSLKHPYRLLSTKIFEGCDIVFNLCAGDGFTDIYGFGRVLSESYMTILSRMKGCNVVLAPQTIGPFSKTISRVIAKKAMNCCSIIFTRDVQSTKFCHDIKYTGTLYEVIDVAFALPYDTPKKVLVDDIGLNVSGLLYKGGYNHDNYFDLSFSYKEYIDRLIAELILKGKNVHLISHVVTADESIEDDYVVCEDLHKRFPNTTLMPRKTSPIEVKSYIAKMGVFIGARMHSTIAAFSSGVPVIPIAYSRKVNGLYSTLEYPYYIDAKDNYTVESAIKKTLDYIEDRDVLHSTLKYSEQIYKKRLGDYIDQVKNILEETTKLCR